MSNPYSAYKKQSVSTMTPVEVVIKLYSETERQLAIGVSAIESKDIKKAHEALMKAQELLGALVVLWIRMFRYRRIWISSMTSSRGRRQMRTSTRTLSMPRS